MTKTLLTSSQCGPCTVLKNKLNTLKLEVVTKDYSIEEHKKFFTKHNIRSVPRLVIEDGDNVEIIQGIEEIIERIKSDV